MNPILASKKSGSERERLHKWTSGLKSKIALINEKPIPEEPPVTITIEKRLSDLRRVSENPGVGIFCVSFPRSGGVNRHC